MDKIKKSFRGYNKSAVEELVDSLEKQLEETKNQYTAMVKRLHEAESAVEKAKADAKAAIDDSQRKDVEIRRLNSRINEEIGKAVQQNNTNANTIGNIFIKAYESGSEIAVSSKNQVNEFLNNVDSAAENAMTALSNAKSDFAATSNAVNNIISEINAQTETVRIKVAELADKLNGITAAYSQIEQVKSAADNNMRRIIANYNNEANNFIDGGAANTIRNDLETKYPVKQSQPVKATVHQIPVVAVENTQTDFVDTTADFEDIAQADTASDFSDSEQSEAQSDFADTSADFGDIEQADTASDFSDSEQSEAQSNFEDTSSDFDTASDFNSAEVEAAPQPMAEVAKAQDETPSEAEQNDFVGDAATKSDTPKKEEPRNQNIISLLNRYSNFK